MNSRAVSLYFFAALTVALFLVWGALVRRGTIKDRRILSSGVVLGVLAMASSAAMQWPDYAAHRLSLPLLLFNVLLMAWVTGFCVMMSYRNQRSEDIGTWTVGDTKFIVRVATVSRIPEVQAMLLPTQTSLKMNDGLAGMIGIAAGRTLQSELNRLGPVGMGKVVQTGGGAMKVDRIFHVAVSDPLKPVDVERLRKGIEAAAQQARKAHVESLVVPVGPLRGLLADAASEAIVGGVLRQRKAFAEVIFLVLEGRYGKTVVTAVDKAVSDLASTSEANTRRS